MNFKQLFISAIAIQLLFISNVYSMVSLTFFSDKTCIIACDEKPKVEFTNIQDLSNCINEVTNKYFTVKEIKEVIYDRIWFIGFKNTTNEPYNLVLQGIYGYYPYISIYYDEQDPVQINLKLNQISSLRLYSASHDYPSSGTIDYNDLNKILFNDKEMDTRNLTVNSNWNDYCTIL